MVYEDFTTYTKVEPDSIFTITASRVTCVDLDRDIDAYVYDDKEAGHFGDFEHKFTTFGDESECAQGSVMMAWILANAVGTGKNLDPQISFWLNKLETGFRYTLRQNDGGWTYQNWDDTTVGDQTRYITIKRDGTTLTAKIYSDAERTDLLHTLTLTVVTTTFRYIYVPSSYNANNPNMDFDGYIENLDLQEEQEKDLNSRIVVQQTTAVDLSSSFEFPPFFIHDTYVVPSSVERIGVHHVNVICEWYDEQDLGPTDYGCYLCLKDEDNTIRKIDASEVIEKITAKEYRATYALDVPDVWKLGYYDLRSEVWRK